MSKLTHTVAGEPADKAGVIGLGCIGGEFVVSINGSASAVIGLHCTKPPITIIELSWC